MKTIDDYFHVSELNKFIRDVLQAGFPQQIWVCGELQQFNRSKNKRHVFFDLVEKDEKTKDIKAKAGLVIFANRKAYIQNVLSKAENSFELKDDIEVKFLCKVDFYEPHGAVRLIVEDIDPSYTLGRFAQDKQRLIALLKEQGIFEQNKKRVLSAIPLSIGLITSEDSAAYNDFISELDKSGFGFKIFVRNTIMQGKNCEKDVCEALKTLENYSLDAVVITRGGGSVADLSCFDSEAVAKAISTFPIPVLTGIGHEIDISVTDLAAHRFGKTPTAVARILIGQIEEFSQRLEQDLQQLHRLTDHLLRETKESLHSCALRLQKETREFIKYHSAKIIELESTLFNQYESFLKANKTRLSTAEHQLPKTFLTRCNKENERMANFHQIISLLHPKNTLKRGFSISRRQNGKVIKSVDELEVQETIISEMYDGWFKSEVKQKKKGNDETTKI